MEADSDDHAARRRGRKPAEGEPRLDRAFHILGCFDHDHRALSLTSLTVRSGMPKSSALRIVRKLVERGALERLPSGDYVIGLRLLEIASLSPRGHGLRTTALPYMQDLHHATGRKMVQLAVREGLEARPGVIVNSCGSVVPVSLLRLRDPWGRVDGVDVGSRLSDGERLGGRWR